MENYRLIEWLLDRSKASKQARPSKSATRHKYGVGEVRKPTNANSKGTGRAQGKGTSDRFSVALATVCSESAGRRSATWSPPPPLHTQVGRKVDDVQVASTGQSGQSVQSGSWSPPLAKAVPSKGRGKGKGEGTPMWDTDTRWSGSPQPARKGNPCSSTRGAPNTLDAGSNLAEGRDSGGDAFDFAAIATTATPDSHGNGSDATELQQVSQERDHFRNLHNQVHTAAMCATRGQLEYACGGLSWGLSWSLSSHPVTVGPVPPRPLS